MRRCIAAATAASGLASLGGCTPALDWREVRPADAGVVALFPCRPDTERRAVPLAGAARQMVLHACAAAGQRFAIAWIDPGDPALTARAIGELRGAVVANVRGTVVAERPFVAPGATPSAAATRSTLAGTLPDGRAVGVDAAFFVRGTKLYQATVIGANGAADAVETFFGGLRVVP